jgi:hypothetical protein
MRVGISDESATPSSHFLQERIEKERSPVRRGSRSKDSETSRANEPRRIKQLLDAEAVELPENPTMASGTVKWFLRTRKWSAGEDLVNHQTV